MDMSFLHDSKPGKQWLQVVFTRDVVIQSLAERRIKFKE